MHRKSQIITLRKRTANKNILERAIVKYSRITNRSRKSFQYYINLYNQELVEAMTKYFDYKKALITLYELWKNGQLSFIPTSEEALLDDMYEEFNKRLMKFTIKISAFFDYVFKRSKNKVMDKNGNVLKLDIPTYKNDLDVILKDQLKYVKKATIKNRKTMMDILMKGISNGWGINKITEEATNKIVDFSEKRAKLIARTEIIKTSSIAMKRTMEYNGIKKYMWVAKIDDRTCPICKGYHKKTFVFGKGENPMPIRDSHPNCRCVIVKG